MAQRIPSCMFLDQASEETIDKRIANKTQLKEQGGNLKKQVHHAIYNTLPLKEQVSAHVSTTKYIHNLEYSNKYGKMFVSTTIGIQIKQLSDLSSALKKGQMKSSSSQYLIPATGQIFLSPNQQKLAILNQKQLVIYQIADGNTNTRFPNTGKEIQNITWLNQNQLYGWKFFKEAYSFDLLNSKCQNVQGIEHCTTIEKVGANIIIVQGLILKIFRMGKLQKQIDIEKIENDEFPMMQFNKLFGIKRINNLTSQQFNQDDIYILFFAFYEDPQDDQIPCIRAFSFMKGNLKQEVIIRANEIVDSSHDQKKYYMSQQNEQYGFQIKIIFLEKFVAINVQHTERIYAIDLSEQFDSMNVYDFKPSHALKSPSFFKGITLLKNPIDFQMQGAMKQKEVDTTYLLRLYFSSKQMEGFIPFPTSIIALDEKKLYRRYAVSTSLIAEAENQDFNQQTKLMIQNKRLIQPQKLVLQQPVKPIIRNETVVQQSKLLEKNNQHKIPNSIEVKQEISKDNQHKKLSFIEVKQEISKDKLETTNPFKTPIFNLPADKKQQKNIFSFGNKNILSTGNSATAKIQFSSSSIFGIPNKDSDKREKQGLIKQSKGQKYQVVFDKIKQKQLNKNASSQKSQIFPIFDSKKSQPFFKSQKPQQNKTKQEGSDLKASFPNFMNKKNQQNNSGSIFGLVQTDQDKKRNNAKQVKNKQQKINSLEQAKPLNSLFSQTPSLFGASKNLFGNSALAQMPKQQSKTAKQSLKSFGIFQNKQQKVNKQEKKPDIKNLNLFQKKQEKKPESFGIFQNKQQKVNKQEKKPDIKNLNFLQQKQQKLNKQEKKLVQQKKSKKEIPSLIQKTPLEGDEDVASPKFKAKSEQCKQIQAFFNSVRKKINNYQEESQNEFWFSLKNVENLLKGQVQQLQNQIFNPQKIAQVQYTIAYFSKTVHKIAHQHHRRRLMLKNQNQIKELMSLADNNFKQLEDITQKIMYYMRALTPLKNQAMNKFSFARNEPQKICSRILDKFHAKLEDLYERAVKVEKNKMKKYQSNAKVNQNIRSLEERYARDEQQSEDQSFQGQSESKNGETYKFNPNSLSSDSDSQQLPAINQSKQLKTNGIKLYNKKDFKDFLESFTPKKIYASNQKAKFQIYQDQEESPESDYNIGVFPNSGQNNQMKSSFTNKIPKMTLVSSGKTEIPKFQQKKQEINPTVSQQVSEGSQFESENQPVSILPKKASKIQNENTSLFGKKQKKEPMLNSVTTRIEDSKALSKDKSEVGSSLFKATVEQSKKQQTNKQKTSQKSKTDTTNSTGLFSFSALNNSQRLLNKKNKQQPKLTEQSKKQTNLFDINFDQSTIKKTVSKDVTGPQEKKAGIFGTNISKTNKNQSSAFAGGIFGNTLNMKISERSKQSQQNQNKIANSEGQQKKSNIVQIPKKKLQKQLDLTESMAIFGTYPDEEQQIQKDKKQSSSFSSIFNKKQQDKNINGAASNIEPLKNEKKEPIFNFNNLSNSNNNATLQPVSAPIHTPQNKAQDKNKLDKNLSQSNPFENKSSPQILNFSNSQINTASFGNQNQCNNQGTFGSHTNATFGAQNRFLSSSGQSNQNLGFNPQSMNFSGGSFGSFPNNQNSGNQSNLNPFAINNSTTSTAFGQNSGSANSNVFNSNNVFGGNNQPQQSNTMIGSNQSQQSNIFGGINTGGGWLQGPSSGTNFGSNSQGSGNLFSMAFSGNNPANQFSGSQPSGNIGQNMMKIRNRGDD